MTNGSRLPPAHQPSGIMPAQRPACPPETAAPRRRPAGARPDGSAEQPAPVQAERQASGRAGTTEQERSRQDAARAAPAPPSHTQPPTPASRPTTPSRRPCSRSNPTQPQRPERSRERVQRRGGGEEGREREERRGHRCKFPAQVIICRTRRPTAQGRPSRSDPAPAPPESNRNRPPCCAAVLLLERMQNQRPRNPRRATGDSPTRQQ